MEVYSDAATLASDSEQHCTEHQHCMASESAPSSDAMLLSSPISAAEWQVTGNQFFKQGNLEEACKAYSRALELLLSVTDDVDLVSGSNVLCNRSAALVKLSRFDDAVRDATDAVHFDPHKVKPHYRLATALAAMGRHREAVDACDDGLDLAPGSEQLEELRSSSFARLRTLGPTEPEDPRLRDK